MKQILMVSIQHTSISLALKVFFFTPALISPSESLGTCRKLGTGQNYRMVQYLNQRLQQVYVDAIQELGSSGGEHCMHVMKDVKKAEAVDDAL